MGRKLKMSFILIMNAAIKMGTDKLNTQKINFC